MAILSILLTAILIIVSILLVLIVLLQRRKQEGLGVAFGGRAIDSALRAHTTTVFQKIKIYLAIVFFLSAIGLGMVRSRQFAVSPVDNVLEKVAEKEAVLPETRDTNDLKDGPKSATDNQITPMSQRTREGVLQTKETLYNHIVIERTGNVVELRFKRSGTNFLESAVDVTDPLNLVVPYTKTLFAPVLFCSDPKSGLMIGLGGGGVNALWNAAFPDATFTTVELDKGCLELATYYMNFKETEKNQVEIMDGRVYLRRNKDRKFDWILIDAFRGGYVPTHLKTVEFYTLVRERLNPKGIAALNLHTGTNLFYSDVKSLRKVFQSVLFFSTHSGLSGNLIAVCSSDLDLKSIYDSGEWKQNDNQLLAERVNLEESFSSSRHVTDTVVSLKEIQEADILTDDFAPADVLNIIKRENRARF